MKLADLLDVPFVKGGMDPRSIADGGDGGLDCYGLARLALECLGRPDALPRSPAAALAMVDRLGEDITGKAAPQACDVLEWSEGEQQHLAVCINPFQAIHATCKHGVKIAPIAMMLSAGARLGRLRRPDGR